MGRKLQQIVYIQWLFDPDAPSAPRPGEQSPQFPTSPAIASHCFLASPAHTAVTRAADSAPG